MKTIIGWLGGTLFVLALAYGVYFFVVTLDGARPGAESPSVAGALGNAALFALFAAHHSVMARARAKAWLARCLPPTFERSVFVWVASLLFLVVCFGWQPMRGYAWRLDGAWAGAGMAAQALGLLLIALAVRMLDPLDMAGIAQLRSRPTGGQGGPAKRRLQRPGAHDATAPVMTSRGPYGLVRHPIYLGWILMLTGTSDMTLDRLTFTIASTLYILVGILFEERSLLAHFGEPYRRYQTRVRWRVLPGVY